MVTAYYYRLHQEYGARNYIDDIWLFLICIVLFDVLREAAKKVLFLVVGPLRGGGKNRTTKKKTFFWSGKKTRGGGVRALVVGPLKNSLFAASLIQIPLIKSTSF